MASLREVADAAGVGLGTASRSIERDRLCV